MADKVYPEGVTAMDHVNHDMKMGRFPNQSSVETFLDERAKLAAQEKVGHLPSGTSERDSESDLVALSAVATPGPWRTGTTRLNNPDLWERSPVIPAISPDRPYAGMILRGTALTKEEDAEFIVALVNAYRSGKLKEIDPA